MANDLLNALLNATVNRHDYDVDGRRQKVTTVDSPNGRLGFVSREERPNDQTRYGIGIDNMGSPYRGIYDGEINTPLGTVDYGYDGDTVYGGVTPNINGGRYSNGEESGRYLNIGDVQLGTSVTPYGDRGVYLDRNGQSIANGGILGFDDGTLGVGGSVAYPAKSNYYNEIDTPLGLIAYGQNANTGQAYANFTPEQQYYIQALANLLSKSR